MARLPNPPSETESPNLPCEGWLIRRLPAEKRRFGPVVCRISRLPGLKIKNAITKRRLVSSCVTLHVSSAASAPGSRILRLPAQHTVICNVIHLYVMMTVVLLALVMHMVAVLTVVSR